MTFLNLIEGAADNPFLAQAQRGYETYFGVTQEELRTQAAQAEAGADLMVAAEEAKTMRLLAGAGIVVAVAALLVTVAKKA